MTKASGRYNARSDWLRVRSEQGITQPYPDERVFNENSEEKEKT